MGCTKAWMQGPSRVSWQPLKRSLRIRRVTALETLDRNIQAVYGKIGTTTIGLPPLPLARVRVCACASRLPRPGLGMQDICSVQWLVLPTSKPWIVTTNA